MMLSWGKPTGTIKGTVLRRKQKVAPTTQIEVKELPDIKVKKKPLIQFETTQEKSNVNIKRKHKKDKQKLDNSSIVLELPPPIHAKHVYVNKSSVTEKLYTDSGNKFSNLPIHKHLVSNLEKINFTTLTAVQEKVIPIVLSGKDVLVRSQTGSGKTLTYAVPIVDALQSLTPRLHRKDGVQAMVVVPTRELALQTHELFNKINTFQWIVSSHLCGGENRKSEKDRLRKGVHVLIGTPGRLLDHVFHTSALKVDGVRCLVLDEADQLLDMGFRKDIVSLVEELDKARVAKEYDPMNILTGKIAAPEDDDGFPLKNINSKNRQTILLSASLTKGVSELADFTMKNHVFVDGLDQHHDESESLVIPNTIKQSFILTTVKNRLVLLSALIAAKSKQNSKIFVFMASTQMVDFHYELFQEHLRKMNVNRGQFKVESAVDDSDNEEDEIVLSTQFFKLHGSMDQKVRKQVFTEFRLAKSGILLCTDVAARGIDVPTADCIIQYTGPQTDKDYLHRVGRTGRAGKSGSAIIFLTHEEEEYVARLGELGVHLKKLNTTDYLNCLCEIMNEPDFERASRDLQQSYEDEIRANKSLRFSACLAYSTWSRFYNSYPSKMREIFDFKKINLGHYATSFGLRETPSNISKIVRGEVENMETPRLNQKLSNHSRDDVVEKKKQVKRKITKSANISEFGSGLAPIKKKKKKSE